VAYRRLLGRWSPRWGWPLAVATLAVVGIVHVLVVADVPADRATMAAFVPAWTLPLLAARRFPIVSGLAVLAAVFAETFVNGPEAAAWSMEAVIAIILAMGALATHRDPRGAALAGLAGVTLMGLVIWRASGFDPADAVFFSLLAGVLPFVAARFLVERTQVAERLEHRTRRLEREQAEAERRAVEDERVRIARELHDVIAHSISVMTVQAGAARTVLRADPGRAREAILAVEETGRAALAETRRLLGMLRRDMSEPELRPQPGIATIDALVERMRRVGVTIDLDVEGDPHPVPPGIDLAAYRVVEQALASAQAHERMARATVRVRWLRDMLELEVTDDGQAGSAQASGEPAVALAAMRERLRVYGGTVRAESGRERGCRVTARLPLEVPA
jgi:signal transduction histidine kinase